MLPTRFPANSDYGDNDRWRAALRERRVAYWKWGLAVAVWHVLMGHVIGALPSSERLRARLFKLATEIGLPASKAGGHASQEACIEKKLCQLKNHP